VLDGDCFGVSLGDPAAVEGADSAVAAVVVRRRTRLVGVAVEDIAGCRLRFRVWRKELVDQLGICVSHGGIGTFNSSSKSF
jgi:hypothetical protein